MNHRVCGMQVTCDVRTVSWAMAYLKVDRIDLLKIDVEGAELVRLLCKTACL